MQCRIGLITVLVLVFLLNLQFAGAQQPPLTASGVSTKGVDVIDPQAMALLNEVDAKYKSMQSFSCEVEDGFMGTDGKVEAFRRARVEFRGPYCLAVTSTINTGTGATSISSKAIADGKHSYVAFGGAPWQYTELPYSLGHYTPFDIPTGLPPQLSLGWINSLLTGHGSNPIDIRSYAISVSSKRERFTGYQPLEIVTTRRHVTASNDWDVCTFTIGAKDHLLYQQTANMAEAGKTRVVQYYHPQFNPILNDAEFSIPQGSTLLPLMQIVSMNNETVTLDNGSLDGIGVGDELWVYSDETLAVPCGKLEITEAKARECTALVTTDLTVRPGRVCVKVKNKPDLMHHFNMKK